MAFLDYLGFLLFGILGIIFMVLVKLKALKTRTQVANETFSIISYFKDDYLTLLLSFVTVFIGLGLAKGAVSYQPVLINFMNGIFVGIGYMGTSILSAFFSKAELRINCIIDKKTDQLDALTSQQSQD